MFITGTDRKLMSKRKGPIMGKEQNSNFDYALINKVAQGVAEKSIPKEKKPEKPANRQDLYDNLKAAYTANKFLITVSYKKGDRLEHFWMTHDYPIDDILPSLEHIKNDFASKELAKKWM